MKYKIRLAKSGLPGQRIRAMKRAFRTNHNTQTSGMARAFRLYFFQILIFLAATGAVHAQEPPADHTLRLFPVGDPPPFVQEVREGVRYEIPAAEGTIPPRKILLPSAPRTEGKNQELPLRLRLGIPSVPLSFPLPADGVVMTTTETGGAWIRIPLAKSPSSIAFLWRGKEETWSKPRSLTLPDDTAEGDFRFVNLTAIPVALTWGTEKIKLSPAASIVRRLPDGAGQLPVSIQYPALDGGLRLCYSSQAEAVRQTRHLFVIYAADSDKPRQPVKVRVLSEDI